MGQREEEQVIEDEANAVGELVLGEAGVLGVPVAGAADLLRHFPNLFVYLKL